MYPAASSKSNHTVRQCKESVVLTHTNVIPRMKFGATLANDNVAGSYRLTTVLFHATILSVGVATVARSTLPLLMCHLSSLLYRPP